LEAGVHAGIGGLVIILTVLLLYRAHHAFPPIALRVVAEGAVSAAVTARPLTRGLGGRRGEEVRGGAERGFGGAVRVWPVGPWRVRGGRRGWGVA